MVTARASGQRVEDSSQRTESTQVFADPDGTWTSEEASGPVRAQDDSGAWHDLDLTLVERDGALEPTYAAAQVRFSDGGDRTFAESSEGGKDLAWRWPTVLPAPEIDGPTATYVDAVPGGDLVVTATPTGFSHSIVLRERPADLSAVAGGIEESSNPTETSPTVPSEEPTASPAPTPVPAEPANPDPDPVQFAIPVSTDGAKLAETTAGGVKVTAGGDEVVAAPQPMMWDSSTGEDGEPDNVAPVDVTVTAPGQETPDGDTAGAAPVLTLTPDQSFLADPETQYPVTIDPTYSWNPTGDTWVSNTVPNTTHTSSDHLIVGTPDNGTSKYRAFLQFPTKSWLGQSVTSATLTLRNYYSSTCGAGGSVTVTRVTGSWTPGTIIWGNQPTFTSTGAVSSSVAKGLSASCPDGPVAWNVTNIVNAWARGGAANYGFRVTAQSETGSLSYREYRSLEYSTSTSVRPLLTVTYDRAPNTPTQPTATGVGTYAARDGDPVQTYLAESKPTFSITASDIDGGQVRAYFEVATSQGGAPVATCTSGYVASGQKATCTLDTDLADGTRYYVRATSFDGVDYAGNTQTVTTGTSWSASLVATVASGTPATPTVTCPDPYTDGSWAATAPGGSVTCTVTATGTGASAPGYINVGVDQHTPVRVRIVQSADPGIAKTTVTIPTTQGGHGVAATAESPAGRLSPVKDYGFGWGNMGMAAPAPDQVETTTDTVAIDASGPPSDSGVGTPTASVKWRVAGSGSDFETGWNEDTDTGLTVTNDPTAGVHVTGAWDTTHAETDTSSGTTPITLDPDRPVLLDVQVCVDYPGTQIAAHCTWSAGTRQVLRVAHAFGGNFPTTEVPGGQVALWTGELAVADSDVTVGAPGADLSISRTASSFAGPVPNPANQVFGPGWAASLDGPDAGLGDMTLVDNTLVDGTLQLVDGVGDAMLFGTPGSATAGPSRRTAASLETGDWVALDEDTELSGTVLNVSGTGASTVVEVTEDDGTLTRYTTQSAPTLTDAAVFTIDSVNEAGSEGATTYSHDSQGRVTRMVAPAPAGVTCPATGPLPAGCRAMRINYAISTTATEDTHGDVEGQVTSIEQVIGGATESVTALAAYTYDGGHRLVSVTDPRLGANSLTTAYTYDGTSDRIASVTPAGLKPINYEYTATGHKLGRVTRERPSTDPAGGTATLATIVYNVPTAPAPEEHPGLPVLDEAAVGVWGQSAAPTRATAVFGPDEPLSGFGTTVTVDDVDGAGAGDGSAWADADLTYTDADGRTVNSADYGAGGWQYAAASYDDQDNVVRALSERDIAGIKSGDLLPNQAGTLNVYNAEVTDASGTVILPAGSVLTDSYGTARWIRTATGALAWVRPHTHTEFDQGAPNGGVNPATGVKYTLPTTVVTNAVDPATLDVVETYGKVTTDYSTAVAGNADAGWALGLAGSTTTVMAGSAGPTTTDITSQTRYDATGRVVQTRQPKSNGTDAGTRNTYYYTAGAHPEVAACGNKPAWAGALCQTSFAGTSPQLVTTTITSYDESLNPLVTEETAGTGGGGATRTTTATYRADGAPTGTTLSASGLTGSTALGATSIEYDPDTGLPTTTTTAAAGGNPGGTIAVGYDTWGRQITYAPVPGETTTTHYAASGEVGSIEDPKGTTTYTYDGTDAAGHGEHRGLVTKISVSRPSAPDLEITGAYDAAGALTVQKLPGGITQHTSYDTAGEPIGLSYNGTVDIVDPGTGEVTGTDPDAPWLGWSQDNDATGRVRRDWTPTGAAFTGDTSGAAATGFARDYTYDRAARLVEVKDQTVPVAAAGAGVANPDDPAGLQAITACQIRDYTFDANGNRTGLTRTTGAAGAACPTLGGTGAVTKTWGYDTGDRLTTAPGGGQYVYDAFGRATTIPQADTPLAAAGGSPGAVTLGYYDDDSIKSLAQTGTTTAFGLDAAGRRATSTTTPSTGPATVVERHYVDDSDSPGWVKTTTGTGAPAIERYVEDLGGDLGLTITATDVSLSVVDLRGDQVAQIDMLASGQTNGLTNWTNTDEYGNSLDTSSVGKTPSNPTGVSAGLGYGWLGGKQRATDTTGLLLMGERVYNPGTGSFASTDPVPGGNTTSYAYPQDPVNQFDLTGEMLNIPGTGGTGRAPKPPKKKESHGLIGGIVHKATHNPVTRAVTSSAKATGRAAKWTGKQALKHRGTISTIGAIGVCVFATVGCLAAGATAALVSAQQRHPKMNTRAAWIDFGTGLVLAKLGAGSGTRLRAMYERAGHPKHWSYYKVNLELGIVSGFAYHGFKDR